jgi:hypothetical protein
MLRQGNGPKVVQEIAGHHSSAYTMDTYCWSDRVTQRAAADSIGDLFSMYLGTKSGTKSYASGGPTLVDEMRTLPSPSGCLRALCDHVARERPPSHSAQPSRVECARLRRDEVQPLGTMRRGPTRRPLTGVSTASARSTLVHRLFPGTPAAHGPTEALPLRG